MPQPATTPDPAPAAPVMTTDTPAGLAPQPVELMNLVDAAIEPDAPKPTPAPGDEPTAGQDPSDAPPDTKPDGVPSSTTPDPEGAKPDSEPATPESDKPTPPDPANPDAIPGQAAKPSAEFGELPDSTPPKTRERFETLKGRFDEVSERAERAEDLAGRWYEAITSTGTTQEDFGKVLGVLKAMNSGDPVQMQGAYDALRGQLADLGRVLGRPADGYDPLADHPDLLARVNDEDAPLDRALALEVAAARAGTRLTHAASAVNDQMTAAQQAAADAMDDVKALGVELRAADPALFNARFSTMDAIIKNVVATMPPAAWRRTIIDAYNALPRPAPTPTPTPTPRVPAPLRPGAAGGNGTGGISPAPNSALDAVNAALSGM